MFGAPPKVEPPVRVGRDAALWRGLYPGVDPSLGPLGCPLGRAEKSSTDASGRHFSAASSGWDAGRLGRVRGRRSGDRALVPMVGALHEGGLRRACGQALQPAWPSREARSLAESRSLATTFAGQGDTALFICDDLARVCSKTTPDDPSTPWHALIDPLGFLPTFAAFDFSSRLGLAELQVPSSSSVQDRFEAALPPWLPCFVTPPNRGTRSPARTSWPTSSS